MSTTRWEANADSTATTEESWRSSHNEGQVCGINNREITTASKPGKSTAIRISKLVLHPPCAINTDILVDRGGAGCGITTYAEDHAGVFTHHNVFFGRVVSEVVIVQAEKDIAVSVLYAQVNAGLVGADGFSGECSAAGWRSDAIEAVQDLANGTAYADTEENIDPEKFSADSIAAAAGIGKGILERNTRPFVYFGCSDIAGHGRDQRGNENKRKSV